MEFLSAHEAMNIKNADYYCGRAYYKLKKTVQAPSGFKVNFQIDLGFIRVSVRTQWLS